MGYVIGFVATWLIIEFFLMVLSAYDDFGENWGWSFIFTSVSFLVVGSIITASNKIEQNDNNLTEQTQQIQGDKIVDDVIAAGIELTPDRPSPPATPLFSDSTAFNMILDMKENTSHLPEADLTVPSTMAHIDSNRRNHDVTITYRPDTKLGCIANACTKVRLVQHTDGTFWACKRNYGTCYHYKMAN